MQKFINHTNHPAAKWNVEQISAAQGYGEIVDVPFPAINPRATSEEIAALVKANAEKILGLGACVVLCQGEFNYTFAMVERLKASGIKVLAATTERLVATELLPDGSSRHTSTFRFVQFREY